VATYRAQLLWGAEAMTPETPAAAAARDGCSLPHDMFQPADGAKYLIFSTGEFELPPNRPATLAIDLAVKNLGAGTGDYRCRRRMSLTPGFAPARSPSTGAGRPRSS
jgi:hypothetical protein